MVACISGQGVSSWSAHGLVGAGVGLGMSGKRGGLSGGGGGGGSWGARAGLVSGLTNSVQKRRGLCGESWLGLGSGGVLYWAQNIFSCSLTLLVRWAKSVGSLY